MKKELAIIGGGAAGFFAAINIAEKNKDYNISIYEGSNRLLSKVLISGGGRCNITNECKEPKVLVNHYPRGHKELLPAFTKFNCTHTYKWFESRGLALKSEEDGRIFPKSNSSKSVYDLFISLANKHKIQIITSKRLTSLKPAPTHWVLEFGEENVHCDKIILATGGNTQVWRMLENIGIPLVSWVPSLFTLKAANNDFKHLSGVSVNNAKLEIKGTKSFQQGPFLVTHQGFSGPAVLKLSAWKAFELKDLQYEFVLVVNWIPDIDENEISTEMMDFGNLNPKAKVINYKIPAVPKRLFQFLCKRAQIENYTNWSEFGKKGIKRLMDQLYRCELSIKGKNTFKEEFVTAGGVDLQSIDLERFESKKHAGLHFAGEILNIDAVTGGFNFQSAWTSAYLISQTF
ncbi:MAG: aminoacetone oxidase family FAD-binding enzyme [Bacteroidia bacterium]